MKTSKLLLVVCLFLFKKEFFSQTNLIGNASFEKFSNQHNVTFEGAYECYNPGYIQIVHNWKTINSSDYFDSAYTVGTYNVPYSRFGNSYAKHGFAFSGLEMYYTNPTIEVKEYVYQQLAVPLLSDSVYCLSFFVCLADRSPLAIKTIGAYFTPNNINTGSLWYIQATPQIVNTMGFITDTINWTEIKGCFTALGGEQFITIGNFNSNSNTDTASANPINPLTGTGNHIAYYYLDSVSLWQNNFPTFVKEDLKSEIVSVYPNPAKDVINFKFTNATEKRKVELYDAVGELVLSEDVSTQNSSLNIHHLANGIYFYRILVNGNTVNTNKIVIIK
ncbi:MAG: T9SS type A sorting domain-containing protein [Bacteroidia bacterium]